MKLIVLSDPHVVARGTVAGREPAARLLAAVLHALERHADAARLLILGDLADDGAEASYRTLADVLDGVPIPVDLLLGNHDDRAAFRKVFGGEPDAPVARTVLAGGVPLHCLDTLDPGRDGGSLDGGRLERFEAALAAADAPGLVFMHHPPVATGAPAMDGIGLSGRAAFADVLARHREKVRAVFFGHCHMAVAGTLAGVPAFGLPSTLVQAEPVFEANVFRTDPHAPGGYGVLLAEGPEITLHRVRVPV